MANQLTTKVLVGALALTLAATYLPVAAAQATAFGGQVKVGDGDLTYALAGAPPYLASLCFVDDDGSGTYNPGETVYATVTVCTAAPGTTTVAGNDLRITAAAGQGAGTQVRATHSDFGNPVALLAASIVDFYDADGDGLYSLNDPVYIDVDGAGAVSVGDIRLTSQGSFAAASTVAAGNSDVNNALAIFGGAVAPTGMGAGAGLDPAAWDIFDADGDGAWTAGDVAYIDAEVPANALVTVIDVRLGAIAGEPFGSQVMVGDADLVYSLGAAPPYVASLCFVDDDGSGTYNPGETVYATVTACTAAPGTTAVAGNDLRLTAAAGQAAFTQVRATHSDFGNPVALLAASIVDFYDADGDGLYSLNDPVYIDVDGAGAVSVGDIRLTSQGSFAAASTVAAGNSDVNNALAIFGGAVAPTGMGVGGGLDPATWDIFDADGDGAWTAGDVAYIDNEVPPNGLVTVIDIRLGAIVGEPGGSQVVNGDTDLVYNLAGAPPYLASLCFVDDDGSGTYNPGETVYATVTACTAAPGTTTVAGNDLRITAAAGQGAGTQVRATHSDFGNPVALLAASIVDFYDADGDGLYSLNDPVYIDVDGAGAVSVGDIRLTPLGSFGAASTVAAGNSDVNNALAIFGGAVAPTGMGVGGGLDPATWDIFDADGDGAWTAGDVAYIDNEVPPNALVSVIDVRLGASAPVTPPPPCPTGQILQGGVCVTPPPCPTGQVRNAQGNCVAETTVPPCPTGQTRNAAGQCVAETGDSELSRQLQQLIAQNTALGGQLNSSLSQNAQLSAQVSNLSSQLSQQSQQLTTLNSQLQTLQTENAELREQLRTRPPSGTPGFEGIFALAAIGAALLVLSRRKA